MNPRRAAWCAALLLAAACGGEHAGDGAPGVAAESTSPASPSSASSAPATSTPRPRPVVEVEAEPEPTREDSIAAAREDVSPEWKQRTRAMGSYETCMAQARSVDEAIRPQLEAACSRLPDAP